MADIYFDPDNTADGSRDGSSGHPFLDPSELSTAWTLVGGNRYLFRRGTTTNFTAALRLITYSGSSIEIGAWGTGAIPIITMYREVGAEECTEVSMDAAGVTTPASGTNLWKVPRQFFGLTGDDIWGARRDWYNALGTGVQSLTTARHWCRADSNTSAVIYATGNPVTVYGGLIASSVSDSDWATAWKRCFLMVSQTDTFTLGDIELRYGVHGVRMNAEQLVMTGRQTVSNCRFLHLYSGVTFGGNDVGGDPLASGGFDSIRVHDNYFENMGSSCIDSSASGAYPDMCRMNDTRIYRNILNGFGGAESTGGIYLGKVFTSDGSLIRVYLNSISGGLANNYWLFDGYGLYSEAYTQDLEWYLNFVWNCERHCHTNRPRSTIVWRQNVVIEKVGNVEAQSVAFTRANDGATAHSHYNGNVAVGCSKFFSMSDSAIGAEGITAFFGNISDGSGVGAAYALRVPHSDTAAQTVDNNNFYGHSCDWWDATASTCRSTAPYVTNAITSDPSAEIARLPVPTDPTVNYALQIRHGNRIKAGGVVDLRPGTRVVV